MTVMTDSKHWKNSVLLQYDLKPKNYYWDTYHMWLSIQMLFEASNYSAALQPPQARAFYTYRHRALTCATTLCDMAKSSERESAVAALVSTASRATK
jgi:hypothetical protein